VRVLSPCDVDVGFVFVIGVIGLDLSFERRAGGKKGPRMERENETEKGSSRV
jgi:hypothetical protein